ncbi:MAG TPA: amidase domain-containing protein [Bacillota bacterium]|nr:amidase domain-containing protein [Bacillota bacterium]
MNLFRTFPYNREGAVAYALKWAFDRNPRFYDYSALGGDCTNFASQCILAGGAVMNYEPNYGWYYLNPNQKSPSWTGVEFLYQFLTTNQGVGPYAIPTEITKLSPGDLIQLSFETGKFGHSLVVTQIRPPGTLNQIYISTHSPNAANVQLTSTYSWKAIRGLHILGSRQS